MSVEKIAEPIVENFAVTPPTDAMTGTAKINNRKAEFHVTCFLENK